MSSLRGALLALGGYFCARQPAVNRARPPRPVPSSATRRTHSVPSEPRTRRYPLQRLFTARLLLCLPLASRVSSLLGHAANNAQARENDDQPAGQPPRSFWNRVSRDPVRLGNEGRKYRRTNKDNKKPIAVSSARSRALLTARRNHCQQPWRPTGCSFLDLRDVSAARRCPQGKPLRTCARAHVRARCDSIAYAK